MIFELARLFFPSKLKKKKKGRGESPLGEAQNDEFVFRTLKPRTHRSLFSAARWTSLVGSRQPSSSAWRCCGRGLPGTSVSFPSFFAGPCMPAHSPGTAGRSTRPAARSYSSTCFRTARDNRGTSAHGPRKPTLREPAQTPQGQRPARHVRDEQTTRHTGDYLGTRERIEIYIHLGPLWPMKVPKMIWALV